MKPETFPLSPMTRTLASILVLCLITANLCAQGSKQGAKVRFSVTRFDPMDRPPPEFIVKDGAKDVTVKVPLTHIAGPFSAVLRDDKHLDFFTPGAKAPLVSTVVPPDWRGDLLLVFVPVKETFEILKIRTPPSAIRGGDHYVVNATPADVAIKFGATKPVLIASKQGAVLHDPAAGKAPTLPVIIQQKDGDTWKLVTTENWPHDVRFRTFLFLYTSPRDHHVAIHGVSERVD